MDDSIICQEQEDICSTLAQQNKIYIHFIQMEIYTYKKLWIDHWGMTHGFRIDYIQISASLNYVW